MSIYKPRPIKKIGIRSWQYNFFKALEPGWNSVKPKPLDINMVRGWLRRFNKDMLPTIYAECESSNNFSAKFWTKWKQMPPYKAPKKPKNLTLKMK